MGNACSAADTHVANGNGGPGGARGLKPVSPNGSGNGTGEHAGRQRWEAGYLAAEPPCGATQQLQDYRGFDVIVANSMSKNKMDLVSRWADFALSDRKTRGGAFFNPQNPSTWPPELLPGGSTTTESKGAAVATVPTSPAATAPVTAKASSPAAAPPAASSAPKVMPPAPPVVKLMPQATPGANPSTAAKTAPTATAAATAAAAAGGGDAEAGETTKRAPRCDGNPVPVMARVHT